MGGSGRLQVRAAESGYFLAASSIAPSASLASITRVIEFRCSDAL